MVCVKGKLGGTSDTERQKQLFLAYLNNAESGAQYIGKLQVLPGSVVEPFYFGPAPAPASQDGGSGSSSSSSPLVNNLLLKKKFLQI